jgi:exonuclease III
MSHDLAASVTNVEIHRTLRGAERPSDHVPMVIEL